MFNFNLNFPQIRSFAPARLGSDRMGSSRIGWDRIGAGRSGPDWTEWSRNQSRGRLSWHKGHYKSLSAPPTANWSAPSRSAPDSSRLDQVTAGKWSSPSRIGAARGPASDISGRDLSPGGPAAKHHPSPFIIRLGQSRPVGNKAGPGSVSSHIEPSGGLELGNRKAS